VPKNSIPSRFLQSKWLIPTDKQVEATDPEARSVVRISRWNSLEVDENKTKEEKKWSGPEGLRSLDLWLSSRPHKAPKALPSEGSEDHRDILTTLRAQQVC
jgi:hypothetical protein